MALRLVLFDLVGTLLDERADYEALDAVMEEVRRRYRLEVPVADLSGAFALAVMEIVGSEPEPEEPAEFLPFREAAPDIFAGIMELHDVQVGPDEKRWFWDRYLDLQRGIWRPYREAPEVCRRLAAHGLQIGVVTDGDRYLLDDILPLTPLEPYVSVRVAAEEAGHVKPHPAIFRLAMERAGVRPDETVMVGDSYERDLEGAHAAGIPHLVLLDRHAARTVAVPSVRDLSGLPEALSALPLP